MRLMSIVRCPTRYSLAPFDLNAICCLPKNLCWLIFEVWASFFEERRYTLLRIRQNFQATSLALLV